MYIRIINTHEFILPVFSGSSIVYYPLGQTCKKLIVIPKNSKKLSSVQFSPYTLPIVSPILLNKVCFNFFLKMSIDVIVLMSSGRLFQYLGPT